MTRTSTAISTAELERRWTLARNLMRERGVEALIMQNNNDFLGGAVKWFTDLPAVHGYPRAVVFYRDDLMTVVEQGNFGGRRTLKGDDEVNRGVGLLLSTSPFVSIAYTVNYDADLVADDVLARRCGKVAFVSPTAMYHGFATRVRDRLKGIEITDLTDPIDHAKAIKSAEELKLMRAAAAMQDRIFDKVLAAIKPGMRDIELTALAEYEGQLLGSEQGIFLGSSAPLGQSARFVHRHFQNRTIGKGDHLTILIENNGPGGFYTEIARTVVLGQGIEPPDRRLRGDEGGADPYAGADPARRVMPRDLCRA